MTFEELAVWILLLGESSRSNSARGIDEEFELFTSLNWDQIPDLSDLG